MTTAMEQLYSEVILDHSRRPHGFGLQAEVDAKSRQFNPMCGDEITLGVRLEQRDGPTIIADISWDGAGCSISQASTSVLVEELTGATLATAQAAHDRFIELMHAKGAPLSADQVEQLGDAAAFSGVGKYPARIKCALLGWMALHEALSLAHGNAETPPLHGK